MSHISSPPVNDEHYHDRVALRTMMGEVAAAINKKDWDAVRSHLDPQVIVTMIDQTTLHGPDALHQYVMSKLGQASSILADIRVDPIPDSPATFYGDTAICPLSSTDRFIFRNGREFLVPTRYTATVVKTDGVWKVAAMHGGCNAFNNPISYQAQKLLYAAIAAAGVGGGALGWLFNRRK